MYENMPSIVVDTVARLGAVSLALRLDGPLVFITTVIIILVHLHLTSGGLQMGLLRLRLRWWLRLNRCRSLGRRLRLGLRRRGKLLSRRCWGVLLSALLVCANTWRGLRLRLHLRWAKSWRVVCSL